MLGPLELSPITEGSPTPSSRAVSPYSGEGEVTPDRVSEAKGLSLGNVERLCEALEASQDKLPPLSPLVSATKTEVTKLRAIATALRDEIEELELDAQEARESVQGPLTDVRLLKQQLEAVTVAYVRQGAALQSAKARLRQQEPNRPAPAPSSERVRELEALLQQERQAHATQARPSPPRGRQDTRC